MANSEKILCNEQVYRETAEELGLEPTFVREIFKYNSQFIKWIMENNTFDSIRIPYFGTFRIKPKIVQITSHMRGLDKNAQKIFKQKVKDKLVYGKGSKEDT